MSLAEVNLKNPMYVPKEICRDFSRSSHLEWLDTNHTGAFAMGTVAGVNTRRYHALLLASLNPPADRYSIVPRVQETLTVDNQTFALSTVQYPGTLEPRGFESLTEFSAHPFPTWTYECGSISLKKSVCLLDNQQAVLVQYQASAACWLSVDLFLSCRDYHSLTAKNDAFNPHPVQGNGFVAFQPYADFPRVNFLHNAQSFQAEDHWFLHQEYLRELERGLNFQEDLCSPGSLIFYLTNTQSAYFVAALEPTSLPSSLNPDDVEELLRRERSRRRFPNLLARSLDQFETRRQDKQPTLLAGYPWFTDWSRDTLISLPALVAAGFPREDTKAILKLLVNEKKQGILPNRFSDSQSIPEYNTVDASLWFFVAAHFLLASGEDHSFLAEVIYPAALDIIDWHFRGTFYNIAIDPDDNLLTAGAPGVQLTWMDAKIGDYVVTPRMGKPVEINALWYNALQIAGDWAQAVSDPLIAEELKYRALVVYQSFNSAFWNPDRKCLYDVLTHDGPDDSLRPNQLFALSLPYPLLSIDRAQSVCQLVRDRLLTPVGVRTLDPSHPDYKPRFEGDMGARDRAYHQGTVWPWLIGPLVSAWLYAFKESPQAFEECRAMLLPVLNEFDRCCLGSFSEVYDAEPPHLPGGCPAQLWSVAQIYLAAQRLHLGPMAAT